MVSEIPRCRVVVTLVFTKEMGRRSSTRLRLVQVPGAGLGQIDRAAVPSNAFLANVYGHETGIAEFIFGAMLALYSITADVGPCIAAWPLVEPMGGWELRRLHHGRSWPEKHWEYSATAGLVRHWPGVRPLST